METLVDQGLELPGREPTSDLGSERGPSKASWSPATARVSAAVLGGGGSAAGHTLDQTLC